ncbi:MAG TPA: hypothetical protein DC049_14635 [Spirochaetia bacterium]|nr:hypothetical protein [Spirochaetia bacterium]
MSLRECILTAFSGECTAELLIKKLPEIVYKINSDGTIIYVNEAVKIIGFEPAELCGQNISYLIHPDDFREHYSKNILPLLAGKQTGYSNAPKLIDERRNIERCTRNLMVRLLVKNNNNNSRHSDSIRYARLIACGEHGKTGYAGTIGVIVDITEDVRERKHLLELSVQDELTGLFNRRGFYTLSENRLQLEKRNRHSCFVMFFDLDNVKKTNDTLGHQAGDELLRAFADILKKTFRTPDIIGRMGGDEFAVFPVEASVDSSPLILARIDENIKNHNKNRTGLPLSASCGCAFFSPEAPETLDNLLKTADINMYAEKNNKKLTIQG